MIPGNEEQHFSFKKSFLIAIQGLRIAIMTERNVRIMFAGGLFAIVMGLILRIDAISWACVLVCVGVVIVTELVNTAIETVVDLVSPEFHPLAGRAKDVAAAASWGMCLTSAIVGLIVYIRAFLALIG